MKSIKKQIIEYFEGEPFFMKLKWYSSNNEFRFERGIIVTITFQGYEPVNKHYLFDITGSFDSKSSVLTIHHMGIPDFYVIAILQHYNASYYDLYSLVSERPYIHVSTGFTVGNFINRKNNKPYPESLVYEESFRQLNLYEKTKGTHIEKVIEVLDQKIKKSSLFSSRVLKIKQTLGILNPIDIKDEDIIGLL